MFELIANTNIDTHSFLNPALLFGLVILFGTLASKLCQKWHIPQVVGCIIAGIITIPNIKDMFANRDVAAWLLDYRKTLRKISAEVLTRRKNVEHMNPLTA